MKKREADTKTEGGKKSDAGLAEREPRAKQDISKRSNAFLVEVKAQAKHGRARARG